MDYDLKNRHNWKYHTQETRPLPVAVSAYMHQLNGTKLPSIISNQHNFDKFKKLLKTYLLNQAYNLINPM